MEREAKLEEQEVVLDDDSEFQVVVRGSKKKKAAAASATFADKLRAHGFDGATRIPIRAPVDRWAFWRSFVDAAPPLPSKKIRLGPIVSVSSWSLSGNLHSITIASDKYELQFRSFTDGAPLPDGHFQVCRGNLDALMGDTITGAVVAERTVSPPAGTYDVDLGSEKYVLFLKSGAKVVLRGTHANNDFWSCSGTTMTLRLSPSFSGGAPSTRARAVIVVGPPASGKTEFVRENFRSDGTSGGGKRVGEYQVVDDQMRHAAADDLDTDIAEMLHRGGGVVVADSALCNKSAFRALYDLVARFVSSADQICVVYFENNNACQNRPHWLPPPGIGKSSCCFDAAEYDATIAFIESAQCDARMKHRMPVWNSVPAAAGAAPVLEATAPDAAPKAAPEAAATLFVGNLPLEMTEAELVAELLCDDASVIVGARIVNTKNKKGSSNKNTVSRGFGFVTYASEQEALRALARLDGKEIDGGRRTLRLARVRPGAK